MSHEIYLIFCHLRSFYLRTHLSNVLTGCEDQSFQKFIKDSYFSIVIDKYSLDFNHLMPNEGLFFYCSLSLSFYLNIFASCSIITKNQQLNFINLIFADLSIITQLLKKIQ
jgi:hypothetical protein